MRLPSRVSSQNTLERAIGVGSSGGWKRNVLITSPMLACYCRVFGQYQYQTKAMNDFQDSEDETNAMLMINGRTSSILVSFSVRPLHHQVVFFIALLNKLLHRRKGGPGQELREVLPLDSALV